MQAWGLLARARHIVRVAAAELMHALGRQFQHPVRERGQEVAVVRNEQHGALELPAPFGPTNPAFSPFWMPIDASMNKI
jgi:hypothetical protein